MTDHRITELDSGVRIVTEAMPSVRSVALGYWIGTGSRHEREPEAGLSHLIEHLLFKGSDKYPSVEIDQLFDAMGAELNAGTGKESTSLYARVIDAHLADAFDVMSEMVFRPAFRTDDVDSEREVILEEIAMYEDDPQDKVFDVLGEAVFGTHPLGRAIVGTAEVVAGTPIDAIRAFHAGRYVPRNVVIAAAGAVDHDALVELARARVPDAGSGPLAAQPVDAALARQVRFERKDTEQYHVCVGGLGLARDDERRFALRVLDTVFGGTSSSRLFQEVREERGLAYAVLLVQRPVRRHRTGRPLRRHAARQARSRDRGDRARAGAAAARAGERRGAGAREGEPEGPRRALARVDGSAHEPARLPCPRRRAAAVRRRGDRAHRRRDARRPRRARRRAVRAGQAVGRRHRARRRRVRRRDGPAHRGGRRMIRVAVAGAAGKMGATVCEAVEGAPDMELTGRADPALGTSLADVLPGADVVVDFTRPDTALANAQECIAAGVHVVIGTTGFDIEPLRGATGANVFFAPNFAIGAVLMMKFAAEAARHMAKAEIVELHHDRKRDKPSGTAARTAELMAAASGNPAPPIHSVRLPGIVANQEVVLGDLGQTLTIRHDTIDRVAFMPGVLLAVRSVADLPTSPLVGLEHLL